MRQGFSFCVVRHIVAGLRHGRYKQTGLFVFPVDRDERWDKHAAYASGLKPP